MRNNNIWRQIDFLPRKILVTLVIIAQTFSPRIDNAAAASWTNAPDNFGERSRKCRDPADRPALERSPPSPQFAEAKKARRLVLCESNIASNQPEPDPDLSGSPTFSGQGELLDKESADSETMLYFRDITLCKVLNFVF